MLMKVILVCLMSLAVGVNSGAIGIAPAAVISARTELAEEEFDSHPEYSFSYSVDDALTGDNKQQHETRSGDSVVGQYSFIESDGTRRTVDYTADDVNGFNAVVTKTAAEVPVTKVIASPPPTKLIAAPIYAAPEPVIASARVYTAPAPQPYKIIQGRTYTPVVSHAPVVSATYSAPIYSHESYYHTPTVFSHSPLTYHAPATAIIHH
ncbi:CLUMA_CG013913, isoform A [Clunio marinus]|uniref:CLUMA_CG013913, isoform A n=1 Tax=Clunio marinus TaxID=568069 RepID=A0A1J1IK84_9DIPT|nr:CLUMA_CG013913, isoform A [Clunio marinus]